MGLASAPLLLRKRRVNGGVWDSHVIQSAITMDTSDGPRVLLAHYTKRKRGVEGQGTYTTFGDRFVSPTCFCFFKGQAVWLGWAGVWPEGWRRPLTHMFTHTSGTLRIVHSTQSALVRRVIASHTCLDLHRAILKFPLNLIFLRTFNSRGRPTNIYCMSLRGFHEKIRDVMFHASPSIRNEYSFSLGSGSRGHMIKL